VQVRRFFQLTGALIILFAAGLVAKAVMFLQGAGDLGSIDPAVFDVTSVRWLSGETQAGRFLAGIFGWDPRPSFEQVAASVGYLVPTAFGYLRSIRRPLRRAATATAAPTTAAATASS
jgi:high-affinity iron transporter